MHINVVLTNEYCEYIYKYILAELKICQKAAISKNRIISESCTKNKWFKRHSFASQLHFEDDINQHAKKQQRILNGSLLQ